MDEVGFTPGQAVHFRWDDDQELEGVVDVHQRAAGWVMVRVRDFDHKWARLLAVRERNVWVPKNPDVAS